jgi:hypothetical protein
MWRVHIHATSNWGRGGREVRFVNVHQHYNNTRIGMVPNIMFKFIVT